MYIDTVLSNLISHHVVSASSHCKVRVKLRTHCLSTSIDMWCNAQCCVSVGQIGLFVSDALAYFTSLSMRSTLGLP